MPTIENDRDIIDSREIIERLEELEALRRPFAAGWNMPGYMPDNEPACFETYDDAKAYIADEIRRHGEELDLDVDDTSAIDAAKRCEESDEETGFGETVGEYHFWITDTKENNFEDPEDETEYKALKDFADEASGLSSDWAHGETLIRYSYWVEYVQELLEDIGNLPKDLPHYIEIDWQATARNIAVDYTTVSFDGVEYYIRSC